MRRKYNKELIPFARQLRKEMTKQEKRLWYDFLRDYPVRFTRQKVLGYYIADFYCAKAKLVVELDGAPHFDREAMQNDVQRDAFISGYGIKVMRFHDNRIDLDFPSVCSEIDRAVMGRMNGEN